MNKEARIRVWLWFIALLGAMATSAQTNNASFQIAGTITRPDDGCTQALVILCDAASGEPLCCQTLQPFTLVMGTTNAAAALDWMQTVPDASGYFQFTHLPAGNYLVVAQSWDSPTQPTNILKFHSETVHLLGCAEITLPSANASRVQLAAPGTNSIRFDQAFGNDDGLLLLGTRPQRGDAVLAWLGWGTNFISHLIGCNLMPHGRTTVHGLPAETYASIFMNDNSPGFGSTRLQFGVTNVFKMHIVAGWSDGYKTPPANLVWLVELLQTNKFEIDALLGITNKPPHSQSFFETERERFRLALALWGKEISLPTGQKTRVSDLLTAFGYARLNPRK